MTEKLKFPLGIVQLRIPENDDKADLWIPVSVTK